VNSLKKLEQILKHSGVVKFVLILGLISLFFKIPGIIVGEWLAPILGFIDPLYDADQQIPALTTGDFIISVIVAPLIETLLGQLLPIAILSRFTQNRAILITVSGLVFGLMHFPVIEFLLAAFCVGIILSWGYLIKLPKGKLTAFTFVTLIHAFHNLIAYLLAFLTL
jgi:uncharacterized protein